MTLIKSISGIRGTIGGGAGEGLNPLDIVKFTSAYATLIRKTCKAQSNKIVVGRDARISGEMVKNVVVGTLMGMGWDVVDIDLASTPTTELAVTMEGACGGIILTASHNPKQWNALKLLNEHGEFLNAEEGNEVLRIAEAEEFDYADVDHLGSYRKDLTCNPNCFRKFCFHLFSCSYCCAIINNTETNRIFKIIIILTYKSFIFLNDFINLSCYRIYLFKKK